MKKFRVFLTNTVEKHLRIRIKQINIVYSIEIQK